VAVLATAAAVITVCLIAGAECCCSGNGASVADGDTVDDFIRLGAATSQDLFAASTGAIAQERAAVEAVLKNLKDAGDLPSKLEGADVAKAIFAPQERDGQIADLVFGGEFDMADADGGMVLLKAAGDANESPISLASVAVAHPDLFSGHIGVEPSIDVYQAIDMGFEELSTTEKNVPVAKTSMWPSQHAQPGNHYSANASKASKITDSRKSAAALTVSTFAGGLRWLASRRKSDEDAAQVGCGIATRPLSRSFLSPEIGPNALSAYVCRTPAPP
jgi:hypothetical protein